MNMELDEERLRSASNWYEALQRQVFLMRRQARMLDDGDTWFDDGANACQRAMRLWREEKELREDDIAELQSRIAAIEEDIRDRVAWQLEQESAADGWQEVARALREEKDPEQWLDW